MKRRKALHRGLALLLALVMSLGSSMTVLAAEPPSDPGNAGSVVVVPGEPSEDSDTSEPGEPGEEDNTSEPGDSEPGEPGEDGNTSEPDGSEPSEDGNTSEPDSSEPGEDGNTSEPDGSEPSEDGNTSEPDGSEPVKPGEGENISEPEPEVPGEAESEFSFTYDSIYNFATGELTPIPEIMPLISSEEVPGFSGTLRAEWCPDYPYPEDYFIQGSFYVYGDWSKWYIGDELAYCLQPLNLNSTEGLTYSTIEFNSLSWQKQDMIARAMLYGSDGSDTEEHICTQVLIWEIALGQVSAVDLSHTGIGGTRNSAYYIVEYYGLDSIYEQIKADMMTGLRIPSFMVSSEALLEEDPFPYQVPTDGSALELEDENGVLSEFDIADGGGYTFEKDGNTLRVTVDDPATAEDPYDPEVTSDLLEDAYAPSILAVGNGTEQIKGILVQDPAGAFFRLSTTEGGTPSEEEQTVEIDFVKMDPEHFHPGDYNTSHVQFAEGHDSDDAAFDDIAGAGIRIEGDGKGAGEYTLPCTVELGEGTFEVTEIMAPGGYYINDGWTATITVTIPDPPEEGEGGEGGEGGEEAEQPEPEVEIEVDYGDYIGDYGEEPEVDPEDPVIVLYDNRQKGELTITKIDFENNYINHNDEHIAQGDATFEGAVFGLYAAEDIVLPTTGVQIYSKDDLVATATTDANGSFTITDIEIGNYYLQELVPSTGYVFKNEELRGQIYEVRNPYQVFEGASDTEPGEADPDDIDPPEVNTLDLEKPAEGTDYTGTSNEYENTVIKGDLTIIKSLDDDEISNEEDEDSDPTIKPKAEGIYFGVYLKSKANAGGNDFTFITNDPVGDGTQTGDSTQGYTGFDLVNDNYYSPLPDEYFTQKPLDPNNPPELVNPSIDGDATVPTDPAQIYLKDLYMVLRTNEDGYASTLDPSTIVWSVARAGQGDGYSNQMENGGADLGFPQDDPNSSSPPEFNGNEAGGKVNNMQLPYGEYVVVELNPDEGRDPMMFEVFIGRDPSNPDQVEEKPNPGEDYPYDEGYNNFEYVFNIENDTLKQTITIVKTDAETGKVVPQAGITYKIWSWDNETLNNVTGGAESEHPIWPYYHSLENSTEVKILVPPTLNLDYSELQIKTGDTVQKPQVQLDFDTPAGTLLNDGSPQITWTDEEKALIAEDFSGLTIDIEDTSVAAVESDGLIHAKKAGTTAFRVILPYGMDDFKGTITVSDDFDSAPVTLNPKKYECDGHWIHQTINYPSGETIDEFQTDESGRFTLNNPLVYGDYLLYEVLAPEGYVLEMTPYPFTVEKSDVGNANMILNLSILQADTTQKGRIVLEKIGNMLVGAEEYTTLLGMTALRPLWELLPLGEGVEFDLYAREDIVTPEGTKWYSAGEFIETLTTDRSGMTVSRELPLGKYYLKERRTVHGYMPSDEEYDVELTYQGQTISVYPEFLTLENARQNVIFRILKQFQTTSGDLVPANDVYFGIYAAEDIYLSPAVNADDIPDGNTGVDGPEEPTVPDSLMTSLGSNSLALGDETSLTIQLSPEDVDDDSLNIFGYDESVIRLEEGDEAGVYRVISVGTGSASITVATVNGLRTVNQIEVVAPEDWVEGMPAVEWDSQQQAQGMTVAQTVIYMTPGETRQLDVELYPAGVADTWRAYVMQASSGEINGQVMELDPTCVTIGEDGFITANSVGAARFAVVTDGGLRVIGGVVVTDQPQDDPADTAETVRLDPQEIILERSNVYLAASSDSRGTAKLDITFLAEGCDETFTVTVDDPAIAAFDNTSSSFIAGSVGETGFTVTTPSGLSVQGTVTVVTATDDPAEQPAYPAAIPASSEVQLPTDSRVVIPKDSLIEVVRIVDGEGRSTIELPLGKYYARELQGPDGYIIDTNTRYDFEFTYNPNGETEVIITANGGRPIVNYPDNPPDNPPDHPHDHPEKEYGRLVLEYEDEGIWEKDNPVTGVAEDEAEEAPENITHEFIYESDSPEGDYAVPDTIQQGGANYELVDVSYQLVDETHSIERTVQIPAGEEIPETITVEENGEEVTLTLVSSEAGELSEQVVAVTGEIDFGYTVGQPSAPATKQVSYTDTTTGQRRTATAYLTGIEMVEDYHWRDDVVVDGTFYGGPDVDGFRLGVGNTIVPYRSSRPALDGYEDEYLEYLGLSKSQYRLTGAEWAGEWTEDDRGNEIRLAEFTGERYVARWVAHYSTSVNTSAEADTTAVYSNNASDSYTIKAVATYALAPAFPVGPVAATAAGVIALFVLFLIAGPNVVVYDGDHRRIYATRVRSGRIDLTKAKAKRGSAETLTVLIKKRYAASHVGQSVAMEADGQVLTYYTIPASLTDVTAIV